MHNSIQRIKISILQDFVKTTVFMLSSSYLVCTLPCLDYNYTTTATYLPLVQIVLCTTE